MYKELLESNIIFFLFFRDFNFEQTYKSNAIGNNNDCRMELTCQHHEEGGALQKKECNTDDTYNDFTHDCIRG